MSNEKQNNSIEQKKERVLESATTLFSKKGYDATTMGEIAKEAAVSFGLVSIYFDNKESLYTLCVSKPTERYLEEMLKFDVQPKSYHKEISNMIDKHMGIISTHTNYLRLLAQVNSQHERFPSISKIANNFTSKLTNKLETIIQNGQNDNQLSHGNPERTAIAYVSFLFGLRLSYIDDPSQEDWNEFSNLAKRLFGLKS